MKKYKLLVNGWELNASGHELTDEEVQNDDFTQQIGISFKAILPFFDYMSEILTTNLNGESLI